MNMHTGLLHPSTGNTAGNRPVDVIIIGAGAAGLSTAYALKRAGISVRILERSDRVATPWRNRHPQLHLNTHRQLSRLTGMGMPRNAGAYPNRNTLIGYLEDYARFVGVPVEFGVEVLCIDETNNGWVVETSAGAISAPHVVVATGRESIPFIPDWPGKERFGGSVIHSADFGDVHQYRDKHVLVVGAGNSGSDILNHLATVETRSLHVSVRHGPTVAPSRILGFPLQRISPFIEKLPDRIADRLLNVTERLALGRLSQYGLPQHPLGAATRLRKQGVSPAIDNGFIAALRIGRLSVVSEIECFDETGVVMTDGMRIEPDVVIAATGYRTGLEPMLGHLRILDKKGMPLVNGDEELRHCQGLRFIGMRPSLSGFFRAARVDSEKIATVIRKDLAGRDRPFTGNDHTQTVHADACVEVQFPSIQPGQ